MKLSILDEVLDGNFQEFLGKPVIIPEDVEEDVAYAEEKLLADMTKEQQELFDDYRFEYLGIVTEHQRAHFKRGFRFGLMLAVETCYMECYTNEDIMKEILTHSKKCGREHRTKAAAAASTVISAEATAATQARKPDDTPPPPASAISSASIPV